MAAGNGQKWKSWRERMAEQQGAAGRAQGAQPCVECITRGRRRRLREDTRNQERMGWAWRVFGAKSELIAGDISGRRRQSLFCL